MALHFVADLEVYIGAIAQHRQVNLPFVMPDDVLGAGPLTWTVLDEEPQLLNILGSHSLGHGLPHGDL